MPETLMETRLNLPNRRSGKVRDLYDVTLAGGEQALLIVATDRISAFDVVMANGLPGKGVIFTQISRFWFDLFSADVPHHLISTDPADVPGLDAAERALLRGRMMLSAARRQSCRSNALRVAISPAVAGRTTSARCQERRDPHCDGSGGRQA